MKIYNVEEHLSCFCYTKDDKPLVEVHRFDQIESDEITLLYNEIVFILKGSAQYSMHNKFSITVNNGRLIFLPANCKIHFQASPGTEMLVIRIKESVMLCNAYNLNRLKNYSKTIDKPVAFETLKINPRLLHFATGLLDTYVDGLKCHFYFKEKLSEALVLLRAYYAEEQLFRFFYYYFTPDAAFAEFIHANHSKYQTVNEFAKALNITPQQFSRRFNVVFGEAPYGWMQRKKAQLIYGEICRTNRTFKEIADEYGFQVQSNFNRFCKSAFKMAPKEIRKQKK